MRVLFIYTNINVRAGGFGDNPAMQLGIASISALLKRHGHETGLVLVGEPTPHDRIWEKIAAFVRTRRPDLFQICGGPHATLAGEKALTTHAFDAVCVGDGEFPMLELVESLAGERPDTAFPNLWFKGKDGGIIRNAPRPFHADLDGLPFMDRDLFASVVDLHNWRKSVRGSLPQRTRRFLRRRLYG